MRLGWGRRCTGSSFAITTGGTGAFTSGNIGVSGSAGNANANVAAKTEAAQDIAASINAMTSKTNVSATADTSVAFTVTAGSISFSSATAMRGAQTNGGEHLGDGVERVAERIAVSSGRDQQQTGQTGVIASVDANNKLVLTQSQGDNISITGFAGTGTLAAGGTTTVTSARRWSVASATGSGSGHIAVDPKLRVVHGGVGYRPEHDFGIDGACRVQCQHGFRGELRRSTSSTSALQQLENVGAQLGAVQQRLQATASNLQTTNTN